MIGPGRLLVLDGGLSTALEELGHDLPGALWTARLVADDPSAIVDAHLAYLDAGADVVITSSYQASVDGFVAAGYDRDRAVELVRSTTAPALEARRRSGRTDVLVAASVGPYGATRADGSEYTGSLPIGAAKLTAFHRGRLELLAGTGADLLACETMPSVVEVRAVVQALHATAAAPPAWITFQCRSSGELASGEPVEEAARAAAASDRVVAVGVNCTAPEHVAGALERIARVTDLPLVAYPNAGATWNPAGRGWTADSAADPFADVQRWLATGAVAVGGCCGHGPAAIADLARRLRR
jgi:homocysteine S-methyltransferase